MNINKISKYCYYFNKLSAFQFGPEEEWIPEEFKKLDVFENFPLEKAEKVFASFGLNDFVTEIDLNNFSKEDYAKDIIETMSVYLTYLSGDIRDEKQKISEKFSLNKVLDLLKQIDELKEYLKENKKSIRTNKQFFIYPENTNIIKIYNDIIRQVKELNLDINTKRIGYDDYKDFEKTKPMYLVFSTKPSDLAGISSKGIESCQSLFGKGDCYKATKYNKNLSGSILSKYVGVCYLTRKSDYKGRGWKMISRAIIRQVLNAGTWEPSIIIDKLYPIESDQIYKLMKDELQKKSSIPVLSKYEYYSYDYFSPEHEEESINEEYRSYNDDYFKSYPSILNNAKSKDPSYRENAALELKPKDLLILINDEDEKVRTIVANRLPTEYLEQMLSDKDEYILKIIATRFSKENPEKLKLMINKKQDTYVLEKISEICPLEYLPLLIWENQDYNIIYKIARRVGKDNMKRLINNNPESFPGNLINNLQIFKLL